MNFLAIGQNFALVLQILVIGVVVWLIHSFTPLPAFFKRAIYFIAVVIVCVLLFGFLKREVPELFNW